MEKNNKNTKPKTKRKTNSKNRKWFKRCAIVLAVFVIIFAVLAGWAVIYSSKVYSADSRWLYIPRNSTPEAIRDSLVSTLGEDDGTRVYKMWKFINGRESKAHGAYFIETGVKDLDIARKLKSGAQTPVKITFNNARSLEDVAEKITVSIECSPGEFLEASKKILTEKGYSPQEMNAAFLPDTYEAYWTDTPEKLIDRLLKARNSFWNEDRERKAAQLGLSSIEVATLASIVEEETQKYDERPVVARLYLNRLGKGMKLQADPTVKFAVGDPALKRITNAHLKVESPYNTYLHDGLPPGPIRIPEKSTLDAVLNAPNNDYLYMCAKEDFSGYHNFTSNYNTHLANARRYQAELNRRGIR